MLDNMYLTGIKVWGNSCQNAIVDKYDVNKGVFIELSFSDGSVLEFSDWRDFVSTVKKLIKSKIAGVGRVGGQCFAFACYTDVEYKLMRMIWTRRRFASSTFFNSDGIIYPVPEAFKLGFIENDLDRMPDGFWNLYSKYCLVG